MPHEVQVEQVLSEYPADCQPSRSEYLAGAGGFSGALLWRLETPSGPLCFRRWPREHPTQDRLEFIQAVLWHVNQQGFCLTPVPRETTSHAGYVACDGHLWELAPWMPGQADYHEHPSPVRLAAAMRALAEFHLAASTFPLPHAQPAQAPGILERRDLVRQLVTSGLDRLVAAIRPSAHPELTPRVDRLLQLARYVLPTVQRQLETATARMAWVLPCLRDVWHDHVLYSGERVSGMVDFGALRADCASGDIARLLASLVDDDPAGWQSGMAAYREVRELLPAEELLVGVYDRSSVLLSGLQWLEWIYVAERRFANWPAVLVRIDTQVRRLEHLAAVVPVPPGVARL